MLEEDVLVREYIYKHHIKPQGYDYSKYRNSAKKLLKQYSFEEILAVIDYTSKVINTRIRSFAYFQYIMEDTLQKIKAQEIKNQISDIDVKEVDLENVKFKRKKVMKYGKF